jgi:hypothetical protein
MARLILPSGHRALIDDDFCRIILAYHWYFDGRYVKSQLNGRRHLWYRDPNTYLYLHRDGHGPTTQGYRGRPRASPGRQSPELS